MPERRAPEANALRDYENLGELPRSYGGAFLFAIARDPHTIFVYWDIDWVPIFEPTPPIDRKVHLRLLWHEGIEESTVAVEPLAGSHLLSVLHARSSYRVEIGYYAPEKIWNSVAISSAVITPPDDVAENGPIDVEKWRALEDVDSRAVLIRLHDWSDVPAASGRHAMDGGAKATFAIHEPGHVPG